ncbi:hypothetical protein [Pseudomonas marginalis]|uniref:hypothetical protein n=1 Tax=Pseudomonas marginalis TaxID=298 RepID=UPI002033B7DB|nr:hypothetical protein [Pseudomonas marginalis]MCM2379639.1 hypothetical protein [Pseudomonas marginalis]
MNLTLNELLDACDLPPSAQHNTDDHEPRRALDAEPGEMYRAAVALANGGDGGAAGQRLALRDDRRYRDATTLGQRRGLNVAERASQDLTGRKARGRLRD